MSSQDETGLPPVTVRIVRIFIPFAVGYFLSYLYRTVNAVIADELTVALNITAAGLGLLTSAYFLAFGAFQLPLGILLDRFGPRRVEAALLVVAGAGSAVFSQGESLATLAFGRALIGAGVSACLMAAITANVRAWPAERLPLVNGVFMACGGFGAVFATTPVRAVLTMTDWRGLFLALAGITVVVALLLLLTVPEFRRTGPAHPAPDDKAPTPAGIVGLLRGTARIFASPFFWRLAPASVLMQGAFLAYLALWTGPWLRDVDGYSRPDVAGHLQDMALAMVAGYAGFGVVAEVLRRRGGLSPTAVCVAGMGVATLMQAVLALGLPVPAPLAWSVYACAASASVMVYSLLAQGFPAAMAGRVITAANLLMFMTAFALQSGIGAFLNFYPPGTGGGYSPEGHRTALLVITVAQVLALLWQILPRRAGRQGAVRSPD
mgnify:CR=1 FL=1